MKFKRQQQRAALFLAAGVALLIASFPLDEFFLELVESLESPVLSYFFHWISYELSVLFVLLVMTSLFMWREHKRDWIIPTWLSFLFALVLSYAIKFIVAKERPWEAVQIFGINDYSFPSSHAAAAFAVVPLLDAEYPMFKWFWVSFAVLVAVSRLFLKMHFLSDIIAGALLGYCVGLAVLYLKRRHLLFG